MIKRLHFSVLFCTALLLSTLISVVSGGLQVEAAERLAPKKDKYIVVIDPGHGGENLGTEEGLYASPEKTLDYITGLAAYNELSQYDNVEVYLTRTEDVDISLKSRVDYAASINADYFFSIHYNASLDHKMYGAEVWVSQYAPYNQNGYQFGVIELELLKERGLFIRGVKTRKSENEGSDLDYYGVIRHCVSYGITPVIIEHAHLDQAIDAAFCKSEDQWKELGVLDATAIAKYLGLYSSSKGVDYRNQDYISVDPNMAVPITIKDQTAPDYVNVEITDVDSDNRTVSIRVDGCDNDSPLMYYCYSTNGGLTFSDYYLWPGCDTLTGVYNGEFTEILAIESKGNPNIVVRAINMFDAFTDSTPVKAEFADSENSNNSTISSDGNDKASGLESNLTVSDDDLVVVAPIDTTNKHEIKGLISNDTLKLIRDGLLIILLFLIMLLISVFVIVTTHRKRKKEEDDEA